MVPVAESMVQPRVGPEIDHTAVLSDGMNVAVPLAVEVPSAGLYGEFTATLAILTTATLTDAPIAFELLAEIVTQPAALPCSCTVAEPPCPETVTDPKEQTRAPG